MRKLSLNLLLCASLAGSSSFAANLVVDPDFSNGLRSWVANDRIQYGWTSAVPQHAVTSGCVGSACVDQGQLATANYLYQNLRTEAGSTYDLSLDFGTGYGDPSELKVLWDGNVVLDLVNAPAGMNHYSLTNLVATSGVTSLMFLGRQDPWFMTLTNIDVEPACAVAPEPASLGFICGAIGLAGIARSRSRRKSRA